MRIFLIGFMGCGKSYLGQQIAKKLDYPFVDLDNLIEEQEETTIKDIFKNKGENHFRQLEKKYLDQIVKKFKKIVIATGGGTPCFLNNMQLINKHGMSIYLTASEDILFERLIKGQEKRPLIHQQTPEELKDFIKKSIKKREKFYLQADVCV